MKEIGAMKALAWYRELDMDYRSLKTGGQCEAIMNLAPRLLQWSLEPPANQAAADHFGLDPGQDLASANAIFSRLADSFKNGSNVIRLCILKVLLYVYRGHRKARTSTKSLLSGERISDYVEVLKKVKTVARSTDLTARCLAIRALGCLAQLDCDSSDLHRLVLLSMDSTHEQEVEAAFFAAGCFSENSPSFAAMCSRKLKDVLETSTSLDFAAIRVLSKMWISSAVAADVHKFGEEMLLKHPNDEVAKVTLAALSNLAGKAKLLLPSHVRLLLEYANSDRGASVQMLSLVYLTKLLPQSIYYLESVEQELVPLFTVVKDTNKPSVIRCQALRLLQKVATNYPIECLSQFISLGEVNSQDGQWSVSFQALRLLVELVCKLERSRQPSDSEVTELLKKISSLLCHRLITSPDGAAVHCYRLTLRLVVNSTKACYILVESLAQKLQSTITKDEEQNDVSGDTVMRDATDDSSNITLLEPTCRCLLICATNLDLNDSKMTTICERVTRVSQLLSSSGAYDKAYMGLLPAVFKVSLLEGLDTPEYAQQAAEALVQSSKFWPAYKLAKTACIFGQWDIAEGIYRVICDVVTSEACYFWLKALLQLCSAEKLWSKTAGDAGNATFVETGCQSLQMLKSSVKSLEAGVQLDRSIEFEFQRRFVRLRIRLLQIMMEAVALCNSVLQHQRVHGGDLTAKGLLLTCYGKAQLIASDFQALAGDFYILSISFIGIDNGSLELLYARMFESSLLAFCTAFAFLPWPRDTCNGLKRSRTTAFSFTYKADVFEEVAHFIQGRTMLQQFYDVLGRIAVGDLRYRRNVPWFKTQPATQVVKSVWKQALHLKFSESNGATWTQEKGIPFLNEAMRQLFREEYVLPRYFFNSRPRTQLRLHAHTKERYFSVPRGSPLSLSLGLEVINLPAGFALKRLSCILALSGSTQHVSNFTRDTKDHVLLKWLAGRDNVSESENTLAFISSSLEGEQTQGLCSCTIDVSNLSPGVYQVSSRLCVCTDKRGVQWMLKGPRFDQKLKVV
ncbi:integrator complex subunit 7 isoform X2 [Selaginella moellendorffii]|uniref:integrator complex subunit 7 isoform X2 n=1 Tax=Selaginella moellendorffii TaxID=88036 RepID=UPI000D1C458E|nr:integrator complex subunit 7 isoform X2 [Selaginella moellendorffii]|eukprot:XP_024532278.1 integrator complex subunit 7 isoform X2 [Selaginella moellendorffii]